MLHRHVPVFLFESCVMGKKVGFKPSMFKKDAGASYGNPFGLCD